MNLKKCTLVLLLAVVMLVGMLPMASAADLTVGTETNAVADGTGSSVVRIDAAATQMTVTVPSILPASIDTAGNVTVASDAEMRNQSYGPVTVTAIKAEGLNGWSLAGADYNFAKAKVGSKSVRVAIDNAIADAVSGTIAVLNKWIISGGDNFGFTYGLRIPAQKEAIPSAQPAKVIFTVDWYDGTYTPSVEENPETGEINRLSLDKDFMAMYPGTAETIHATASTEQMVALLSLREAETPVTWTSTNEEIATVENGKVTAHAIGRATIKAFYKGITASCAVQVKEVPVPLEAIGFSKTPVMLMTGESETVLLTYNPEKFTGAADVTFSVNGDAVSVQPSALNGVTAADGATPVVITATDIGNAVVTANATVDGKTVTAQMSAQVMVPLESLTITGRDVIIVDGSVTLTAAKYPENTTDTTPIVWASSDENIATVDGAGVVTGVAPGDAVITATCGEISASYSVGVAYSAGEWSYSTNEGTNTITLKKYQGASNDVVVHNRYAAGGEIYNNVVLGPSTSYSGPFVGSTKRASFTSITLEEGVSLPANSEYLFYNCSKLARLNAPNLDTSNVTNTNHMFYGCTSLVAPDVSAWNTSNITNTSYMFYNCSNFTSFTPLNISNWDTGKVENMSYMFSGCSNSWLTTLDISKWDTSSVTNMEGVFRGCSGLTSLDISKWKTSSVKNMSSVFYGCNLLVNPDVSMWDTSSVTDMSCLFFNCTSGLTSVDVSNWNTSNVTKMENMFSGCQRLAALDVSRWDVNKVTKMTCMFGMCAKLTSLDLSNWDTNSATDMTTIFDGCTGLEKISLGSNFKWTGTFPNGRLPKPSQYNISGADGNWYTADGTAYNPSSIPSNTANTYYATSALAAAANS